ncbi:hypothetical protein [Granulicoccus phenolivorans]|uniref:hypothetical protein n=1 Tax=Granulicoccus phenolivorans TaxID=266854 RepID=UPI000409A4D7|nr:hypothetical protein [Granulicoccus phenolivorans]
MSGFRPPPERTHQVAAATTVRRPPSNARLIGLVVGGLALITALAVVLGLALAGQRAVAGTPTQLTPTTVKPSGEPVGLARGVVIHLSPGWQVKESQSGTVVLTDADNNLIVFAAETDVVPETRVVELVEGAFRGASQVRFEPTGPITGRDGFPSASAAGEGSVTGGGGSGRVTVRAAVVRRDSDAVGFSGVLITPTRRYSESVNGQFTQMLNTGYVNLQQS